MLNEFTIDSPFFNTEERNVKKGFDVVLSKTGSTELWLAEVKSGNIHANKDVSQTAVELINTAQNDLNNRLNGDSVSLWLNAVNGAKAEFEQCVEKGISLEESEAYLELCVQMLAAEKTEGGKK